MPKQGTHKLPEVLQGYWRPKNIPNNPVLHVGTTHGDIFYVFSGLPVVVTLTDEILLKVRTNKVMLPNGIHFYSGHPGRCANIAQQQNSFMDQGSKELVGAFHQVVTHLEEFVPRVHLQFEASVFLGASPNWECSVLLEPFQTYQPNLQKAKHPLILKVQDSPIIVNPYR